MKSLDEPMTDDSFVWSRWFYQPEGLSYDWTSKLLYVTDYRYGTVTALNPFKKQARIQRANLNQPRSIAVHPAKGYVVGKVVESKKFGVAA